MAISPGSSQNHLSSLRAREVYLLRKQYFSDGNNFDKPSLEAVLRLVLNIIFKVL